jgi:hypothetical protein
MNESELRFDPTLSSDQESDEETIPKPVEFKMIGASRKFL